MLFDFESNHYTDREPPTMKPSLDDVIYWVRSCGASGKDRVPMFFKGQWGRNCADGMRGDVKARPVSLGPGEFTATYNPDDFENEDGTPVRFPIRAS